MKKIIDAHIHVGLPEFYDDSEKNLDIARDLCNTYESTIELMNRYEIEKAVLLPIPHKHVNSKQTNAYVYEGYCKFPERFIPFCRIDDDLAENIALGFQGVKLHLVYEDVKIVQLKKQLQIIEDAGIPIMLHALFLDKVEQIKQILKMAPNIRIILAHMGRGHIYTGEQVVENAIGLRPYPNVYFDTSTVGDLQAIINVGEILGYDRIVYGSDYPFGKNFLKKGYDYNVDIANISEILTSEQKNLVFYTNILHLLSLNAVSKVQIRRVKNSDYKNVVALIDQLSDTDKKFLALSSYKYSLIKQKIRSERHCYIAIREGEVVGFLRESGRAGGYSLLEEIAVSPKYRNQGIAKTLLQYYHNIFPKNFAKTNSKNQAIIHLLQANGYIAQNPDAPRIINWERNGFIE